MREKAKTYEVKFLAENDDEALELIEYLGIRVIEIEIVSFHIPFIDLYLTHKIKRKKNEVV